MIKKQKIPHWVKIEDFDHWVDLNKYDRCAYYFLRMNEEVELSNVINVDYDAMLQYPNVIIDKLSKELELKPGAKTQNLIQSIKKTNINRDFDIIEKMSPYYKEILLKYE